MREVIDGIRARAPGLGIGVRLSVFDIVPYRKGADGSGVPEIEPSRYTRHSACLPMNIDAALAEATHVLQCS